MVLRELDEPLEVVEFLLDAVHVKSMEVIITDLVTEDTYEV